MNDDMRKYTFSDIFASGDVKSIVIPPIQRDYVQGRMDESTKRIRKNFLDALYDALVDTPITLDFVYGNIEGDGKLIPLDGQQRLTPCSFSIGMLQLGMAWTIKTMHSLGISVMRPGSQAGISARILSRALYRTSLAKASGRNWKTNRGLPFPGRKILRSLQCLSYWTT